MKAIFLLLPQRSGGLCGQVPGPVYVVNSSTALQHSQDNLVDLSNSPILQALNVQSLGACLGAPCS